MNPLSKNSANGKSERTPFLKFYTSDWIAGTIGLTLEQRGFYHEVLIRMWERKGGLPNDPAWVGRSLQCDLRTARRLIGELVSENKLEIDGDLIVNERMMREIISHEKRSTSAQSRGEVAAKSAVSRPDVQAKVPENVAKTKTEPPKRVAPIFQKPESREERKEEKSSAVAPAAAPPRGVPLVDLEVLSERVTGACNGALASQAIAPGLASMSTPLMWLEQGADLERDVLPTLAVAGKKYHGKQIRSWDYFTGMIADAKGRREAGLPAASASAAKPRRPTLGDLLAAKRAESEAAP